MKMKTSLLAALMAAAFSITPAHAAFDTISVNGRIITPAVQQQFAKQALAAMEDPHSVLMDPAKGREFEEAAKDIAIETRVMADYAVSQGYTKDPDVKAQLEDIANHVLAQRLVSRHLEKNPVTDLDVDKMYLDIKKHYGDREVTFRHVLVDNEVVAKELFDKIKKGEPMAEVAATHSLDKVYGASGGLVVWNSPNDFDPALAKVLGELKPGELCSKPFKTGEGWEIVRLEGERAAQNFPKLDNELKQRIYRQLSEQRAAEYALSFAPKDGKVTQARIDAEIAKKAREEGVDKFKDVETEIENQQSAFLEQVAIAHFLQDQNVDEKELKTEYDRLKAKFGERDVQLRQIVVKDEGQAVNLLKKLEAGADFSKLARENTIDKDAVEKGGLTDFIPEAQLVTSLRTAVSGLKKGELLKGVVGTAMGYHVVKLEDDRKPQGLPTFDEARQQITTQIQTRRIHGFVKGLVDSAKVEVVEKAKPELNPASSLPLTSVTPVTPVKPAAK